MLNHYFIFILVTVAISGEENGLSGNFEKNLDVLIPKQKLENTRRIPYLYKNKKVEQVTEHQESSCVQRSQKDEDQPAINEINEALPTSQQLRTTSDQTSSQSPKVDNSFRVDHPKNIDNTASEDHVHEEASALELRLAWPDKEPSRRSDNSPIDPSELAAELQDCLEKKLHQKKPNVVVVMPVLDTKQPEETNDEKYLLSFAKPHGNVNLREADEDSPIISKQESKCNKDQNKDEKVDIDPTGNEIKKESNEEKEQLVKNDTFTKLESTVEKFLRTGIAESTVDSDQNLEPLDGRRRNNYYERLPLTEVVDDKDGKKTTDDEVSQDSVAVEPVTSGTSKPESENQNSRSGVTDRRVCYACSTLNNPSCQNPNRMTTVKYCAGSRNMCVRKTYETGGTSVLIRDCAATCDDNALPVGIVPKYKTCDLCHDDLCNGAYSIKDQGLLIFFLLTPLAICKILV